MVLCAYGSWLMFALIAGEIVRHGLLQAHIEVDGVEMLLSQAPGALLQWVVFTYLDTALLGLFLALTCALVTSFLGYHLWLASHNQTTNEAWKRKDMRRYLIECAQYEAYEAAQKKANEGGEPTQAQQQEQPKERRGRSLGSRLRALLPCRRGQAGAEGAAPAAWQPPPLPPDVMATINARCHNVYDRGVMANLGEVFFPLSQRRSVKLKARQTAAQAG